MTGNKEAYFYLASSLEKIFPDTDCVKKNDNTQFQFLKESFQHFCLYMEVAVITMAKGNILQKALLMR